MACQFVPGYREASSGHFNQPELPIPGLQEELKKKLNRPVPELPLAEDTEEVIELGASKLLANNGNGKHAQAGGTRHNLITSIAQIQLDAPPCPSCGHVTVRNGACYKCLNCGESLGCS
jgi:ribonucleoside-diphosphate reductase alpha chain